MGIGVQGEACGEVAQHMIDTVRGDGTAVEGVAAVGKSESALTGEVSVGHRSRKHIGIIALSFLLPQDFDCPGRDADYPVGFFGFQRFFHDFAIHSNYLTAYLMMPFFQSMSDHFSPSSSPRSSPVANSM